MLYNYQICRSDVPLNMISFYHINRPGKKNCWNPEHKILLEHCKINIFMKGDFSVVAGEQVCSPLRGDLCFLAPLELHYGQVPKDTELDYFEINVGLNAFDEIPDGKKILSWIADRNKNKKIFCRPSLDDSQKIIDVCYQIESAIKRNNRALAFAEVVRCIDLIDYAYKRDTNLEPSVLSKNTQKVIRYIESNYGETITIRQLSQHCGVSESWLSRSFKAEIGDTIHNYLSACRMRNAVGMISSHSVSDIAYICGFSDSSHFISQFKRAFGCTPSEYSRRIKKTKL